MLVGFELRTSIVLHRARVFDVGAVNGFYYVYTLESEVKPGRHYVGFTEDLAQRLAKHNRGEVSHTAKFKPWQIKSAVAFRSRERAIAFESYLKTGSGRAFAKKRL